MVATGNGADYATQSNKDNKDTWVAHLHQKSLQIGVCVCVYIYFDSPQLMDEIIFLRSEWANSWGACLH